MFGRSSKKDSPLNQQQEELKRREAELRENMRKLERMIAEAPRKAEEQSRKQREELLERANHGGSRLDASISLPDRRWDDGDFGVRRRGSLRKERKEGRLIFLLLVIVLASAVIWLLTHLHF